MNRSPLRRGLLLIPLVLALTWLTLAPKARAQCREGCDSFNVLLFLGDDALVNNTTGAANTAIGEFALESNTTGIWNTATGSWALQTSNGDFNTANGVDALNGNTTGSNNTAIGVWALRDNTTGGTNSANGVSTLTLNTTGSNNTATGAIALYSNTTGNSNTATGYHALSSNTTANQNTAIGSEALFSNTTGNNNTASGNNALLSNTTGFNNIATGVDALRNSTTGNYCTATGQGSLFSNTTGRNNTATGQNALRNNTTGSFNVALGDNAGFNLTTGSNNIEVGNRGVAGEANTIRMGKQGTQTATFIAGVSGATVPTGVAVIVDSSGHLGTSTSSARFKKNIQPMDKASEAILALKPVTFRYKQELDPDGVPQFGLVAEEVEKVNVDLVARDEQGKPYTVRYEAVNAMLLNEFLKEHRTVQELKSTAAKQEATIAIQQKQIDALTAGLQKVNAQFELGKTAPRTVLNNR